MGNTQGYSYTAVAQWMMDGNKRFGRVGYLKAAQSFTPLPTNLSGQTFVVTGANSGLGRETAAYLALHKAQVHMVCRSKERGERARQEILKETQREGSGVTLHVVDLASVTEVKAWAERWESTSPVVHGLILNAGFIAQEASLTSEGLEPSWATALTQSYLLTGLLTPSLLRASGSPGSPPRTPPARVINVSSGGGLTVRCAVDDMNGAKGKAFDGTLQYAHSKRAQMMLAEVWGGILPKDKVHVSSMHPGWSDTEGVQTQLADFREKRKESLRSPAQGADTILWLATTPTLDPASSGSLYFDRAIASPHYPMAGTKSGGEEVKRLWEACAKMCSWEGPPIGSGGER